jgi:TonB-linked SusC/RagA family outer membrane protein
MESFILKPLKERMLLCTLIFVIMGVNPIKGQANDLHALKISTTFNNHTLAAVFEELGQKSPYIFSYNASLFSDIKISASFKNKPLDEVIAQVLRGTNFSYQTQGKYIIVVPFRTAVGYQQQSGISGTVRDTTGVTLPGVIVSVNNKGVTSSDKEGKYTVQASAGTLISFSMIGYETVNYIVQNQRVVNITLKESSSVLNEVMVVGYGTQKKTSITGAVSSVSAELLTALPVPNISQALQGRVAGLTVTNNGGPGAAPIIQIRGVSSINASSSPLYVVDGVPAGNMGSFDNADVQSVEVLKDASAAAIYGSRATNGVILITTKKGKNEKLSVNFNSFTGIEASKKRKELLNTAQYLQYERALNGNAGIAMPPRLQPENFNLPIYEGSTATFATTDTDWQDAYFKTGLLTQQHLSVTGGNEVSRFYTSAGYFKQEGITQGLNYYRGNFRINSEHTISKAVTFGETLLLSFSRQRYESASSGRSKLLSVIRSLPYLPVFDPTTNGGYRNAENSVDGSDPTNPVEDAVLLGNNHNNTSKLFGSVYLNFTFTPWLSFRSTMGLDHTQNYVHSFSPIFDDKGRNAAVATINDQNNRSNSFLFTQQLTADKTFGKHHFNAVAVFETQSGKSMNIAQSGNQSTNDIETFAGATNVNLQSTLQESFLLSAVGRLNYDFENKYLLSAAIRRDGYSAWAPGYKFATFPSVSAGWRINREGFMQHVKAISELKLRAGYGITGLASVGNYAWQALVNENASSYPFNNVITVGNATYYNQMGNSLLEWEKTKQLNVGLDLGLFQNKLTFSAEYYKRETDNLILQVPTPMSFGLNKTGVLANVGSMYNRGYDLQVGYHKNEGTFTWDLIGLISTVKNKVIRLNSSNAIIDAGADANFGSGYTITRTEAGRPIQSFYGFVTDGIFQNQEEIDNSATQVAGKTAPGDIRFKDLNNDGVINSDDRTFLGNYLPKFSYSLNYAARYKGLDLSIFFQGQQGNKIYNAARIMEEGMARLYGAGTAVLNAWTPTNTNTAMPRAINGDPNQNARASDRWIEDGSYLRLKNLTIGYTIPKANLTGFLKGSFKHIRIYAASQNLFTFTKYKGWDPEIGFNNGALTSGVDYGQYPSARSLSLGLQVGL